MSDAFALKNFVGVVNAPHLSLAHKPQLEPYVRLSEALGSLQAQTLSGPMKNASVTVELSGAAFNAPDAGPAVLKLVECAILKGLLPSLPGSELDSDSVNMLNGPLLAKSSGISVIVKKAPTAAASAGAGAGANYSNMIRVSLKGDKDKAEHVVVGSVVDGEPRVVQLDHWEVRMFLAYRPFVALVVEGCRYHKLTQVFTLPTLIAQLFCCSPSPPSCRSTTPCSSTTLTGQAPWPASRGSSPTPTLTSHPSWWRASTPAARRCLLWCATAASQAPSPPRLRLWTASPTCAPPASAPAL